MITPDPISGNRKRKHRRSIPRNCFSSLPVLYVSAAGRESATKQDESDTLFLYQNMLQNRRQKIVSLSFFGYSIVSENVRTLFLFSTEEIRLFRIFPVRSDGRISAGPGNRSAGFSDLPLLHYIYEKLNRSF